MSRPKSMSDFTNLFDTTYTPLAGYAERDRRRKKPSISLAAGLIMNGNGASETQSPASPRKSTTTSSPQQPNIGNESGWSEGLFYAYAQKVYTTVPTPFIDTLKGRAPQVPLANCISSATGRLRSIPPLHPNLRLRPDRFTMVVARKVRIPRLDPRWSTALHPQRRRHAGADPRQPQVL